MHGAIPADAVARRRKYRVLRAGGGNGVRKLQLMNIRRALPKLAAEIAALRPSE